MYLSATKLVNLVLIKAVFQLFRLQVHTSGIQARWNMDK